MRDHPSGRPVKNQRVIGKTLWRIPDKGPVIPRLQREQREIAAIGFTAEISAPDDDE